MGKDIGSIQNPTQRAKGNVAQHVFVQTTDKPRVGKFRYPEQTKVYYLKIFQDRKYMIVRQNSVHSERLHNA